MAPNVRVMSKADLAETLKDELFALREHTGTESYPKAGPEHLNDWPAPDMGWLSKSNEFGTDESQFVPARRRVGQVIAWSMSPTKRQFAAPSRACSRPWRTRTDRRQL